jgi:hypothetical protein
MKFGFYTNGKQRWFCNSCKKSFCWKNLQRKQANEQIWFKQWIVEGYSVRQLAYQSNHNREKLYRIINFWLNHPPEVSQHHLDAHKHLIFDGTFLDRPVSILTIMDGTTNTVITGKYGVSENSDLFDEKESG